MEPIHNDGFQCSLCVLSCHNRWSARRCCQERVHFCLGRFLRSGHIHCVVETLEGNKVRQGRLNLRAGRRNHGADLAFPCVALARALTCGWTQARTCHVCEFGIRKGFRKVKEQVRCNCNESEKQPLHCLLNNTRCRCRLNSSNRRWLLLAKLLACICCSIQGIFTACNCCVRRIRSLPRHRHGVVLCLVDGITRCEFLKTSFCGVLSR